MSLHHPITLRAAALAALLASTALTGVAIAHAEQPTPIQPTGMATRLPDFTQLVQQVKPAVVSITVQLDAQAEQAALTENDPGPGALPFGLTPPQARPPAAGHVVGQGSGFIISADGAIVTNNHVVQHAKSVMVVLDDGTKLKARVIGHDPATDIAVVKVDAGHPLPFLGLGDSSQVQPGEWVIAVGNPYGLNGSVTAGIVSARGRDLGNGPYDSFIQVDAPINRGNSGGPLLTQDGKVVGVNTAIISPSGGSIGIGFAAPSNTVRQVADQIIKTGHVTRGYLGVSVQPITQAMARALHLPDPAHAGSAGALVASVEHDSPADRAGIVPGDVILAVDGTKITDPRTLAQTAAGIAPGTTAKLAVLRDGTQRTIAVDIGTQRVADAGQPAETRPGASLGLTLAPLTPDVREQLGLGRDVRGAAIAEIRPNSPADRAGLQPGDVVLGVDGHQVTSPAAVVAALGQEHGGNRPVALRILRDGQPGFVAIDPSRADDGDAG